MLLIRSRRSPVRQKERKGQRLSFDAIMHLIMAPLYLLLLYGGLEHLKEAGFYKVLKEILLGIGFALLIFQLFSRFGKRMRTTNPRR